MLKYILLDNYFPDIFTEDQIRYWYPFTFGLGQFFRKISKFQQKYDCFQQMNLLLETSKAKENFEDNHFHNIL